MSDKEKLIELILKMKEQTDVYQTKSQSLTH